MPRLRSAALLTLVALGSSCSVRPAMQPSFRPPPFVRVRVVERGVPVVRTIDVERYVAAAALSEFAPPSGEPATVERMLEVQAVIARTYALGHLGRHGGDGFDLCSTTHCQLYEPGRLDTSRWASAARDAAERTRGQVLSFDDAIADVLFHSDCGGRTSDAFDVWGGTHRPYLAARVDDGVPADTHTSWTYTTTLGEIRGALDAETRATIGAHLDSIAILDRDRAGRVQRLELNGASGARMRGVDLREALARAWGARSIRSTRFDIVTQGQRVTFAGTGFGHGVGLCQVGAFARIRAGDTPRDVLRRYYPGTTLMSVR